MRRLPRWLPGSAALAAAALLAGYACRVGGPIRRDRPVAPDYDPPPAETAGVGRRADFRAEAAADLIAGRITGAEAHARFLDANRSDPTALKNLRSAFPDGTDEERTAHQLVWFVRRSRHPRAPAVEAALAAEFLGQKRLPTPPTDGGR